MYNKYIIFLYKIYIDYLVQDVIIFLTNQTTPKQKHLDNPIGFTLPTKSAIIMIANKNCINQKGGDDMEVMEMTDKELITTTIDRYTDLQQIKKANGNHENEMLDYLIKVTTAKLSSLGVNVEDITLQ